MNQQNLIEEIQRRASIASPNEIYSSIAAALPESERQREAVAASLKVSDVVGIGKNFYQRRIRPAVKDLVCGQVEYCKNRGRYDTAVSITGLVAEQTGKAIAQVFGFPAEAGGVAGRLIVDVSAAILKEGLNELCSCPG